MKNRFKSILSALHTFSLTSFILLCLSEAKADQQGTIRRPPPADPVLLSKSLYSEIYNKFPQPPQAGSIAQKQDEDVLRQIQKLRTEADCKRALAEVDISLESHFVKNDGPLTQAEANIVKPIIKKIGGDSYYFSEKLKVDFPRKRPFEYMKDIHPCVPKEITAAFPSGHAVLSKLEALVLGDLIPEKRKRFEARSEEIANHRVLAGIHHPSDIDAGRKLADILYNELKKSAKYQEEFDQIKKTLKNLK